MARKKKDAGKSSGNTIPVSVDLRTAFELDQFLTGIISEAEKDYKEKYYKKTTPADPIKKSRNYQQADASIKEKTAEKNDLREALITLFVKENRTQIGDLKLSPKLSIEIDETIALGMLDKKTRNKVQVKQPVFDLLTFLKMVKAGEIPLQVLLDSAKADYTVQVNLPKGKKKK